MFVMPLNVKKGECFVTYFYFLINHQDPFSLTHLNRKLTLEPKVRLTLRMTKINACLPYTTEVFPTN